MGHPESGPLNQVGVEERHPKKGLLVHGAAGEGQLFRVCLKAGRKPGGRVKDSWGFKLLGGGEAGGWGGRRPVRLMQAKGGQGTWGSRGEALGAYQRRRTQVPLASVSLTVKWEDAPPITCFLPCGTQ